MKKTLLAAFVLSAPPFLASAAVGGGRHPATYLIGQTWASGLSRSRSQRPTMRSAPLTAAGPVIFHIIRTMPINQVSPVDTIYRLAPASGRWFVMTTPSGVVN